VSSDQPDETEQLSTDEPAESGALEPGTDEERTPSTDEPAESGSLDDD
jgi:hypothetical protein